ncbi:hypothetical protein Y032_0681g1485 [Ancylostoma ceylanicum]|uniref:Uncharacterized protein n=1 Tax=Ancylostoma ceylanicum TaxID=53326 RepID=A0A016WHE2_9BILA|nr:hypothetical protein Y032_0681g1485 [Ancylostoma ceylanicum]
MDLEVSHLFFKFPRDFSGFHSRRLLLPPTGVWSLLTSGWRSGGGKAPPLPARRSRRHTWIFRTPCTYERRKPEEEKYFLCSQLGHEEKTATGFFQFPLPWVFSEGLCMTKDFCCTLYMSSLTNTSDSAFYFS